MQPFEIQREVEALRDIRRRSTSQGGPGTLILDPDLPTQPSSSQTSPLSPPGGFWPAPAPGSAKEDDADGDVFDDAAHLFWVPANVHPELAPGEFRAFLKEHARVQADGSLRRSSSTLSSSSSLGRKSSMLRRQYKPSANDNVEEEDDTVLPLRRNRSALYAAGPQLTISDLQKLEQLAEEASKSDDPTKLRSVLRRSLSLNVAPSSIDQMDDVPDMTDDADAPIIVPPPGQILRRAARTKIRKSGLSGDGGGHRFASTRRGTRGPPARRSSDLSSTDQGELAFPTGPLSEDSHFSRTSVTRPDSFSEESSIYAAYARDDNSMELEEERPVLSASPPPITSDDYVSPPTSISEPSTSPPPVVVAPPLSFQPEPEPEPVHGPVLHHPQPQRSLIPPSQSHSSSRTPSPEYTTFPDGAIRSRTISEPASSFPPPSPSPPSSRKDKEKKGLFGKWGGDKTSKKSAKEKEKEREREKDREREKEKDTGFFGSLFGKKKQDDQSSHNIASGRETAAALLGASKSSKNYMLSPSPQLAGAYARYPIHVERAVYRLSHIKLANPRRPLYEQVLISNLMFWYLGVINKAQNQDVPPQGQGIPGEDVQVSGSQPQPENDIEEKERMERIEQEQRQREEQERQQREMAERERERERLELLERERLEQKKENRRGALTKTPPPGATGSARHKAEMPVRGPQYDMQHRVMAQEYGPPLGGGMGSGRASSAPPPPIPIPSVQPAAYQSQSGYSPRGQAPAPSLSPTMAPLPLSPTLSHPQPLIPDSFLYGSSGTSDMQQTHVQPQHRSVSPNRVNASGLPPGAMAPIPVQQSWQPSSPPGSPTSRVQQPKSPIRSSPAIPAHMGYSTPDLSLAAQPNGFVQPQDRQPAAHHGGGKLPSRSLSATALPVHNTARSNGKLRKGTSVQAVAPVPRLPDAYPVGNGEEEDVPLAVWQQQRRR